MGEPRRSSTEAGRRPRALDLYCGAGGASKGLRLAGYEVDGADVEEQPEYPFSFECRDALSFNVAELRDYDLIWASPPCQAFTAYKRRHEHVRPRANLIPRTRELLVASGVPFIIENVTGARAELREPIMLCGSMFGLDVQRHRLFETSSPLVAPPCRHDVWTPRFAQATNRTNKRKTVEVGVYRIPLAVQRRAMGIKWMSLARLSQAIPPAYARWLGTQMRKAVRHVA